MRNRCPNCGSKTLFKAGKMFELNQDCPVCGLKIERDEGFFLGPMSLNYGITVVFFLVPVALLAYREVIGTTTAIVLAGIGSFGVPALLYRSTRSWFLMQYYFFLPQHLPANREGLVSTDDENI